MREREDPNRSRVTLTHPADGLLSRQLPAVRRLQPRRSLRAAPPEFLDADRAAAARGSTPMDGEGAVECSGEDLLDFARFCISSRSLGLRLISNNISRCALATHDQLLYGAQIRQP